MPDNVPPLAEHYGSYVDPRASRTAEDYWRQLQEQELLDRQIINNAGGAPQPALNGQASFSGGLTCGATERCCSSCRGEYAGCPTRGGRALPVESTRVSYAGDETAMTFAYLGVLAVFAIIGCILMF